MRNRVLQEILSRVSDECGIAFEGTEFSDSNYRKSFVVRDSSLTLGTGYKVYIRFLNARIQITVEFESIAKGVLLACYERLFDNYESIRGFTERNEFIRDFDLRYNGQVFRDSSWMESKKNSVSELQFSIYSGLIDLENEEESLHKAFNFITPFLFLVFPYKEIESGESEGRVQEVVSNRYERSRKNRSICLAFHGHSCQGCGLLLENKYGSIASNFIHVHHINPISEAGEKEINPIQDLVPLCPNCHSIVHLESPPLSIKRLKELTNYEE